MKIAYSILKRFLKGLGLSSYELADLLIHQGLVVERVWGMEEIFALPIFSALVEERRDKLGYTECLVTFQDKTFSVAVEKWGAPSPGDKVLITFKNGIPHFSPSRGEEKRGLLPFLLTLPENFPAGEDVSEALLGEDCVLDLEITSNRGDCLSIIGIAREVAAKLDLDWGYPANCYHEDDSSVTFSLYDEALDLCPYYTGKLITHIEIRPSSWPMAKDLYLLGLRPINNVVDATNLVMMETGQPLHAFDASKIRNKTVVVRRARSGEKLITIDGVERVLSKEMLVIADDSSPIALAGIMGGENTEVSPLTETVFLESAIFDRVSVRRTSKLLGLRTEASARFERGVDPERVKYASERVLSLLSQEGEMTVAKAWFIAGEPPQTERSIVVSCQKAREVLNCSIEKEQMMKILGRLGFGVTPSQHDQMIVDVPSFRSDVSLPIDIIEEIGRINGYGAISSRFPTFPFDPGNEEEEDHLEQTIRNFLVNRGYKEIVTLSLINPKTVQELGIEDDQIITIKNPLSQEHSMLRSQLLVSFLEVLRLNMVRERNHFGIFEVSKVFSPAPNGEQSWKEEKHLGIALCGSLFPPLWSKGLQVDLYVLKGLIEEMIDIIGLHSQQVIFSYPEEEMAGFSKVGAFILKDPQGNRLGWGGQLEEKLLWKLDIREEIYYAELRVEEIFRLSGKKVLQVQEINVFPSTTRDISLIVDQTITWGQIEAVLYESVREHQMDVEDIGVFDLFEGESLPPDKKSITFRVVFRSPRKTLSDVEVEYWVSEMKKKLKDMRGVYLREEFFHS